MASPTTRDEEKIGIEGAWASVHNSLDLLEELEEKPQTKKDHMDALKRAVAQCGKSMGKGVGGVTGGRADKTGVDGECAQLRIEKSEWEKREKEMSKLLGERDEEFSKLEAEKAELQEREKELQKRIKTKDDVCGVVAAGEGEDRGHREGGTDTGEAEGEAGRVRGTQGRERPAQAGAGGEEQRAGGAEGAPG